MRVERMEILARERCSMKRIEEGETRGWDDKVDV